MPHMQAGMQGQKLPQDHQREGRAQLLAAWQLCTPDAEAEAEAWAAGLARGAGDEEEAPPAPVRVGGSRRACARQGQRPAGSEPPMTSCSSLQSSREASLPLPSSQPMHAPYLARIELMSDMPLSLLPARAGIASLWGLRVQGTEQHWRCCACCVAWNVLLDANMMCVCSIGLMHGCGRLRREESREERGVV